MLVAMALPIQVISAETHLSASSTALLSGYNVASSLADFISHLRECQIGRHAEACRTLCHGACFGEKPVKILLASCGLTRMATSSSPGRTQRSWKR